MKTFRLRPLLALTLCAGLAGATGLGTASAAAPVCNLITDAKGDATGPTTANNDPALDITSSDIASDGKKVTVVIRVAKLAKSSPNYPYGISWRMNFTAGDVKYFLSSISDRSGVVGQSGYTDETGGHIAGAAIATLDEAKNEVRISSSVLGFAGKGNLKPGTVFSELNSVTGAIAQVPNVGNLRYPTLDTAAGSTDYKGGVKSCVKPGK